MDFERAFNAFVETRRGYPTKIEMNSNTIAMVARMFPDQTAVRAFTNPFDTTGIAARYLGVPIFINDNVPDNCMLVTPPYEDNAGNGDPVAVDFRDTAVGANLIADDLVIRDYTLQKLDDGTDHYTFNPTNGRTVNVPIPQYIYNEYGHDVDTAWARQYQLTPVDFNEHITANYDVVFDPHEFTEEVQRIVDRGITEAFYPQMEHQKETPAKTEEDVPDIQDEDFLEVLKGA